MRLAVLFVLLVGAFGATTADSLDAGAYLAQGDEALSRGLFNDAIGHYQGGVELVSDDDDLVTELSLYTNLGTALSSIGQDQDALKQYEKAILVYKGKIDDIPEASQQRDAKAIISQAAFFLGMVYQDLDQPRDAADAYRFATTLDEMHWAAFANLGSVLHDSLSMHRQAVEAYNSAYALIMDKYSECTDPPEDPRPVLSQLQYRIGLCITHDPNQRCAVVDNPDKEMSCNELAANAFSMALKFDETNESARHMLVGVKGKSCFLFKRTNSGDNQLLTFL